MASVFNRGSKDKPRWFIRLKDENGVWRSRRTFQQTKKEASAVARALEAQGERRRFGLEAPAHAALSVHELMERFANGLTNRSAHNDAVAIRSSLIPRFGAMVIGDLRRRSVIEWLAEMASARALEPATRRRYYHLLSRFCSWCVDRELMGANPCRDVPRHCLPKSAPPSERWLEDESVAAHIMQRLPDPFRLMFFLARYCGLSTAWVCGLRLSDLEWLGQGQIRVRYSYKNPLPHRDQAPPSERDGGSRGTLFLGSPPTAAAFMRAWLQHRMTAGATADDLVFPRDGRYCFNKDQVGGAFRKVRDQLGLPDLSWTQATRNSRAARLKKDGAAPHEIKRNLGLASVMTAEEKVRHVIPRHSEPEGHAA